MYIVHTMARMSLVLRTNLFLLITAVLLQHGSPAAKSAADVSVAANELEQDSSDDDTSVSGLARDIQTLETALETVYSRSVADADKELLARLERAEENLSQLYNLDLTEVEERQMDSIKDLLAQIGREMLNAAGRAVKKAALQMLDDLLAQAAKAVQKQLKGLGKKQKKIKGKKGKKGKKGAKKKDVLKGVKGGKVGAKKGGKKGGKKGMAVAKKGG